MSSRLLLVILLAVGIIGGDGKKEGRRGNALYKEQQYEAAADVYYAGLERYVDGRTDGAFFGLQNNLGAALHRQGEFGVAREAFQRALAAAATRPDVARAAYNAGNNEFLDQQAETALDYYRQALLADPHDGDAKFNYEFVKRQLEQQQQQQQQEGEDENQDQQNQDQQNQDQQNQDQQNQDQQNQDQQNQDQQDQDQQDQQNEDQQEQEQQQEQQPTPQDESEQLSRQQAERILQALENDEEELLREVQKMKGRPRRVEKDW